MTLDPKYLIQIMLAEGTSKFQPDILRPRRMFTSYSSRTRADIVPAE